MSMLVRKNVCLNSSSCVSFISSFFPFSFNFFIYVPDLLFTTCLHHVSSFNFRHHSIFLYFLFHAIRSSYLCLSLCSSTLSGHPSSSFFFPFSGVFGRLTRQEFTSQVQNFMLTVTAMTHQGKGSTVLYIPQDIGGSVPLVAWKRFLKMPKDSR